MCEPGDVVKCHDITLAFRQAQDKLPDARIHFALEEVIFQHLIVPKHQKCFWIGDFLWSPSGYPEMIAHDIECDRTKPGCPRCTGPEPCLRLVSPKKRFLDEVVCQRRIAGELEDEGAHELTFAGAFCVISSLSNNLFARLFLYRRYPVLHTL